MEQRERFIREHRLDLYTMTELCAPYPSRGPAKLLDWLAPRHPAQDLPAASTAGDLLVFNLRHMFASWAMMRGVSLKELQGLLGHSSLAMTMPHAHVAPEHLRTAVSGLEGLSGDALPSGESTQIPAQAGAHEVVEAV
jgi:integrase